MKRFRFLLLPLAAVLEILMLLVCWVAVFIAPRAAGRMVAWSDRRLPNLSWYIGK